MKQDADILKALPKRPEELTPQALSEIANKAIGVTVSLTQDQIREAVDPVYFLSIRDNTGGPSEKTVRAMLLSRRDNLQADEKWVAEREAKIVDAMTKLDEKVAALSQ